MTAEFYQKTTEELFNEIKQADILVVSAVERFDEDIYARIPQIIRILNE